MKKPLIDALFKDKLPFSFIYNGCDSRSFEDRLAWEVASDTQSDDARYYHIRSMIPDSSVLITVECKEYLCTEGIEWTLYFTNTGNTESSSLSKILALDLCGKLPEGSERFYLRRLRGSVLSVSDFEPVDTVLVNNVPLPLLEDTYKALTFHPHEGRSSYSALPFFNLDWGGGGLICAIGWSGQWEAAVSHSANNEYCVCAGQEHCNFILYPGEKVRSPRIMLMPWEGKTEDSYNKFRRIMLSHIQRKIDGTVPYPPVANLSTAFNSNAAYLGCDGIASFFNPVSDASFEVLWVDAHYYKDGFPGGMGNMGYPIIEKMVDTATYPHGLKPVSDYAHSKNAEFLLWFEPERVMPGTLLEREHPDWLIWHKEYNIYLLNLGIPEACDFITKYIGDCIEEFGIDILRIDFNFNPLPFWLQNDEGKWGGRRNGISEIKYVEGFYHMWDSLLERFPLLRIDNCASGGLRIDLETCSRSYILWRTDAVIQSLFQHDYDKAAIQNQLISMGLNRYIPFSTSGMMGADPYYFRSGFNAGISFCEDARDPEYPLEMLKQGIIEGKRIRPCFRGNFYVLTPNAGTLPDSWCVTQYHLSTGGKGILLAFRRHQSPFLQFECDLREIDPNAVYEVQKSRGFQRGESEIMRGSEFAHIILALDTPRTSLLIEYKVITIE